MARYIKVYELVKRLLSIPVTDDLYGMGMQAGVNNALKIIEEITTADVVEVKHGEWKSEWSVLANALYFNCSLCGESDPWQGRGRGRAKYCPKCGAKMDGGKEDGKEES